MRSALPKPLHPLCGRPMLLHVLDALSELYVERAVVVVGHGAEPITKTLQEYGPPDLVIDFVEQRVTRGTADALAVALTAFPDDPDLDDADIVVLPGDTPLVRPATLGDLVVEHRESDAAATLLTARPDDPRRHGPGRPGQGRPGGPGGRGRRRHRGRARDRRGGHLDLLLPPGPAGPRPAPDQPRQRQGRVLPHRRGGRPPRHRPQGGRPLAADDPSEAVGVNDRAQLAEAEAELRRRINDALDAGRGHHGRPRPAPTSTPPSTWRPTSPSCPAPSSRGAPSSAGAPASVPTPVWSTASWARGRSWSRRSATTPRSARPASWGRSRRSGPGAHIPPGATTGAFYTARGGDDDGALTERWATWS